MTERISDKEFLELIQRAQEVTWERRVKAAANSMNDELKKILDDHIRILNEFEANWLEVMAEHVANANAEKQ